MLGRSTKFQDRGKPANRDRILSAIGHRSDASAILMEEEGRINLQDHFFIPIIPKSHDLVEAMVLAHFNHIFECLAILFMVL
jgi:hypothetical protein